MWTVPLFIPMLTTFWVIIGMVALLWIPNTRYAVRQYLADRNKLLFTVYMGLLIILGYMVVSLTTHIIDFARASQDVINAP